MKQTWAGCLDHFKLPNESMFLVFQSTKLLRLALLRIFLLWQPQQRQAFVIPQSSFTAIFKRAELHFFRVMFHLYSCFFRGILKLNMARTNYKVSDAHHFIKGLAFHQLKSKNSLAVVAVLDGYVLYGSNAISEGKLYLLGRPSLARTYEPGGYHTLVLSK